MSSSVAEGIDFLLTEPNLAALVSVYFDEASPFAGHTFDDLGKQVDDEFTAEDLLAVTLLDVGFEPRAVRDLLGDPDRWRQLLAPIPTKVPLWKISDEDYFAADALWQAVMTLPGVGPTRAGKLLARKRPLMLPIYDEVISTFLAPGDTGFWRELQHALQDEQRRSRVDALIASPRRPVSTLRILDVAVWMSCGNSSNARAARRKVGIPEDPLVRHAS